MTYFLLLALIGIMAGLTGGFFGLGGGVIIVPALVYIMGFSQLKAVGTSLAVLLPPVGLVATLRYYQGGYVDFKAAFIIAFCMLISSYLGAFIATNLPAHLLRIWFGVFLIVMGSYIIMDSWLIGR